MKKVEDMIKKVIELGTRSEFAKSVAILSTGTFIGQAITLISSPILTRLYSPIDFGYFAVFVAIVSVLLIVATGQYELAITLPKKEKNVTGLVYLTWSISFITSALVFVLLLIFKDIFLSSFKFINYSLVIYFIPIAILTYSLYQPV